MLAFVAVIREGIETSLFLLGQVTAAADAESGAFSTLLGALIGLAIAAGLGFGFYRGARVLNLSRFFRWTGVALVFIAAGLLSHAVHEFIDIGWIGFGTATAFDISSVLPHSGDGFAAVVGQLLRALLGYSSTPEWTTLVAWLAYLVAVLWLYARPVHPVHPSPVSGSHRSPAPERQPALVPMNSRTWLQASADASACSSERRSKNECGAPGRRWCGAQRRPRRARRRTRRSPPAGSPVGAPVDGEHRSADTRRQDRPALAVRHDWRPPGRHRTRSRRPGRGPGSPAVSSPVHRSRIPRV